MKSAAIAAVLAVTITSSAAAQWVSCVSVQPNGSLSPNHAGIPTISGDGRYVMFNCFGPLLPADTNPGTDLYLRNRVTNVTELISVSSSGGIGSGASTEGVMSDDGRYVAFESTASGLDPADTYGGGDIFVRDRVAGTTKCVSLTPSGGPPNFASSTASISSDGRFIVFRSAASNLVAGDTNGKPDIFLHDRATGVTELVSISTTGVQTNSHSHNPSVSADGRYVVFESVATNLAPGDMNGVEDVFLRDRQAATTTLVSSTPAGNPGNNASVNPAISADGSTIVFATAASDILPLDVNGVVDIVSVDRASGAKTAISVHSNGTPANGHCFLTGTSRTLSCDGRFVSFLSEASNLSAQNANGTQNDVFRHDRVTATTEQISINQAGQGANGNVTSISLSSDGRHVAYMSFATNLLPSDLNGFTDIVVYSPWLTLSPEDTSLAAGETLTLTTWRGKPADLTLLIVSSVGGAPVFVPLIYGSFDGLGNFVFTTPIPALPILPGLDIGFRTYAQTPVGTIDSTQDVVIHFE